ncbi:MAG TPA: Gfo/Idh/MocA family oxidoreductase [Acidimicrobiales bacterium]|nr:Gfo/Idh/MocA family oxidoreductase [Acidimicrobiales bacterium]
MGTSARPADREGRGRKARLSVAGLGRVGRVHAANIASRCPSAELASLYDSNHEIALSLSEELGVWAAPSFEALLEGSGTDGVIIATPTASHAQLATMAAKAGKHVFCEKPLSFSRPTTVELISTFAGAGVHLQVGFHRRFDPPFAAAARRVKEGELGDVYLFRASQRDRVPPNPQFIAGSGGVFVDMGIHDFDIARLLVGEVSSVSAYGAALSDPAFADIGDADNAVVVLNFASGALGVLDISRVAGYGYESAIEVMGGCATLRVEDPYSERYEWRVPGQSTRPLVASFDRRFARAFELELEHFAGSILAGTAPCVGGLDALAAFDIAQAAEESRRAGQVVRVPATTDKERGSTDEST